ncbi:MAG: hypothetical protein AB7F43_06585 [Bacteriovoracia bacterium]
MLNMHYLYKCLGVLFLLSISSLAFGSTTIQIEIQEDSKTVLISSCEEENCQLVTPKAIRFADIDSTIESLTVSGRVKTGVLVAITAFGSAIGTASAMVSLLAAANHGGNSLALILSGAYILALTGEFLSDLGVSYYISWSTVVAYWATISYFVARGISYFDPRIPYEQADLLRMIREGQTFEVTPEQLEALCKTLQPFKDGP